MTCGDIQQAPGLRDVGVDLEDGGRVSRAGGRGGTDGERNQVGRAEERKRGSECPRHSGEYDLGGICHIHVVFFQA